MAAGAQTIHGAERRSTPETAWSERSSVTVGDRVLNTLGLIAAALPTVALVWITFVMATSAWPAIQYSGLTALSSYIFTFGNLYAGTPSVINGVSAPSGAQYGEVGLIVGTVASSLIALVVAVPVSVLAVLLIDEMPKGVQNIVSVVLELLASIPSVAFGLWGILFLGPFLASSLYPAMAGTLGAVIPWFAGPVGYGQGLLTASLVLSIMVIPVVAATTRELVRRVPALWKEGGVALGLSKYEIIASVVWPSVRGGVIAAALLGWARALGETMAVLMISGNALNIIPPHIYSPASTMAATIAAMLDSALTDASGMAAHALAEVGVILLLITLITNFLGRVLARRFSGAALPIGRGV